MKLQSRVLHRLAPRFAQFSEFSSSGATQPDGLAWVSDQGSLSTLYDRNNGTKQSLIVNIPGRFPSGQLYNHTGNFNITENGHSGSSLFIFATLTGTIEGWSQAVDLNNAVTAVDDSHESAARPPDLAGWTANC